MLKNNRMDLDRVFRDAAHHAANAVRETMTDYSNNNYGDEDDITGGLVGSLRTHLNMQGGPIKWNAKVMRHRKGVAAEEQVTGADLLLHVSLSTPTMTYSKGLLVQAKRNEPGNRMNLNAHKDLISQCNKMLAITPAAFVFNYSKQEMRCGSALGVKGATRDLHEACNLTPFRFFYEFFRCTIGDQSIVSSHFNDLKIPHALTVVGTVRPQG